MAGKITPQDRWQRDIRQRFKLFSESGELNRLKRKGLGVIGRSKKMTSEELLAEATKGRRMKSPEYLSLARGTQPDLFQQDIPKQAAAKTHYDL